MHYLVRILIVCLVLCNIAKAEDISHDANDYDKKYLEPNSHDIVFGSAKADNIVVEYFSLTCFHCASFFNDVFPELKRDYIDTGQVKWIKRPFITDERALKASLLLECKKKNMDAYTKFLAILLSKQDAWVMNKNYIEILKNISKLSGMLEEEINKCLGDIKVAKRLTEETMTASKKLGVKVTPSFFLNDKLLKNGIGSKELSDLSAKAKTGK